MQVYAFILESCHSVLFKDRIVFRVFKGYSSKNAGSCYCIIVEECVKIVVKMWVCKIVKECVKKNRLRASLCIYLFVYLFVYMSFGLI